MNLSRRNFLIKVPLILSASVLPSCEKEDSVTGGNNSVEDNLSLEIQKIDFA